MVEQYNPFVIILKAETGQKALKRVSGIPELYFGRCAQAQKQADRCIAVFMPFVRKMAVSSTGMLLVSSIES